MDFDDFREITQRRYEYALGIDTRDWTLFRSIFLDEVEVDFSSYSGQPAARMSAEDWVAGCRVLFSGLDATQHVMTNPIVEVDGDAARLRMYMKAEHFLMNREGNDDFALGGYYEDRLLRTPTGWRIRAVTLRVLWNRGNHAIMEMARRRGEERLRAERAG